MREIYNFNSDYRELISRKTPKRDSKAYCTSLRCYGMAETKIGALKEVSKSAVFCPDCNFALFWDSGQRFEAGT